MRRSILLSITLTAVLSPPGTAAIPTNTFTLNTPGRKLYLGVRDGKLTVEARPDRVDWDSRPAPCRWYIEGTRVKSTVGGYYLAYDPQARDGKVFLAPQPGPGTEWAIRLLNPPPRDEGVDRGAVRVGAGPMQGWGLCAKDVPEPRQGQPGTVRQPSLSERPALPFEAERIYEHR